MDEVLNKADSNLFRRDTRELDLRSVKSFFFSFCFSSSFKILLCVFVIELLFLLIGVFFLAALVMSAFGAQSINFFHNTNSELTC